MACLFPQVNPSRLTKFCHQYRLKVKSIVADWYWYCQEFIQLLYLNISVHILHTFFYTFLKVLTILAAIIDMWTFCWRAPEERTMIEQWLFYTSWSRPQMGGLPIWLPLMLFRVVIFRSSEMWFEFILFIKQYKHFIYFHVSFWASSKLILTFTKKGGVACETTTQMKFKRGNDHCSDEQSYKPF